MKKPAKTKVLRAVKLREHRFLRGWDLKKLRAGLYHPEETEQMSVVGDGTQYAVCRLLVFVNKRILES